MTATRLGDLPLATAAWERSQFLIVMEGGSYVRVDGMVLSGTPHLGVHIGTTHYVDVTHIPSGRCVARLLTLGAAIEYVHRVAPLRDWHGPTVELTPEIEQLLRDTLAYIRTTETPPRAEAL